MLRFVIVYLIPAALLIFAVVDCLLTPRPYVRAVPKSIWLLLICLLYVVGPLLWIVAGRAGEPQTDRRRRRVTDLRDELLNERGNGTHMRQRRSAMPPPGAAAAGPRSGAAGRPLAPDDDPEFLRKLGEQMRKDRPEG